VGVDLYNAATGELVRSMTETDNRLNYGYPVFSGDSQWLAVPVDERVHIWHIPDGQPGHTLTLDRNEMNAVAYSPHGRLIAAAMRRDLAIWAAASGKLTQRIEGRHGDVLFSPDGEWLAASTYGGIRLWRKLK
jgi:WD40 repeat protein